MTEPKTTLQKQLTWKKKLRYCGVVLSCFIVRTLVCGFWNSLGIFLIEWQEYFSTSAITISWLGSICCIILWTSSPIASALSHQCSFRVNILVGGFIAAFSLLATSLLAYSLTHIFVTFGLLSFGLGLALLSAQTILIFNFDAHLGIASSCANIGAGFGTLVMPPLFQFVLSTYGWRGCLLISSAIFANISVCGAFLRPTPSENRMRKRGETQINQDKHKHAPVKSTLTTIQTFFSILKSSFDFSLFYTNPSFIAFCVVGLLSGLCYSPPIIYIVAKAVDDGLSKFNAALLQSFIGFSSILGRLLAGILIDCCKHGKVFKPSKLSAVAYALCGAVTLLFPVGHTFSALASIAFGFGFSSGMYNCLVIFVAKEFTGLDKASGALAWFLVTHAFGSWAGIYLSGYIKDVTGRYQLLFLTSGGISFICAIVLLIGPWLHSKHPGHRQMTDKEGDGAQIHV